MIWVRMQVRVHIRIVKRRIENISCLLSMILRNDSRRERSGVFLYAVENQRLDKTNHWFLIEQRIP